MTALRFGIQTPLTRPWPATVALWRSAEALGFDSLWVSDHLVPPYRPDGPVFEAWTALAALAAETARARLGVLVSSNTFRHPALLAKEAVTVDHISGGRLELGLGAGWFRPEHEMFGIAFPETAELVSRFREAVEVVDRLLRHDVTTYDGQHYRLAEAPSRPAPVQRPRPPLVLGAHGPRMLRIVAEHADVWNSIGTPQEIQARNQGLDEACAAIGRDPSEIRRSLLYVPVQLPQEAPWDSPEAFADFVGRYRQVGIREFIFQPPPDERLDMLERVATDVIPALRTGR